MSDIKKLFEQRQEAFNNLSREILEKLPNVLEASRQFVVDSGSTHARLQWQDISYFEEQDFIIILGTLEYSPGETVLLPGGESVTVTEDQAEYFKSVLRLGVPYRLAEHGTTQEIYEFLKTASEMEEDPTETIESVRDNTEFDLEELTDDQRKALEMAQFIKGGTG